MSERVDLTAAETKPNCTFYELERLTIDVKAKSITAQLLGTNGESKSIVYNALTTPTGASLLSALNTSNNSAGTSLIKRVYNRLLADNAIAGAISGSPD
jgi:hypothetical protein